jgi:hypothetical protein
MHGSKLTNFHTVCESGKRTRAEFLLNEVGVIHYSDDGPAIAQALPPLIAPTPNPGTGTPTY